MTIRQAPRGKVTQRPLSAATALVLGVWMLPSLAATGTDSRSDPSMDAAPMSLSTGSELPIGIIERDAGSAANPEHLALDDSAAETPLDASEPPPGARVETILRRIFDEARSREHTLQPAPEGDNFNAPLAADKTKSPEDPPSVLKADPAEASAALPGFGADEWLRYRQQMYRTDI